MIDWTEKYRPKSLNEVIGNKNAINELKNWSDSWISNNQKNKAVILVGKPGIGKTSAAISLAKDYKWSYIELNTSDSRNASKIKKIATAGALNDTFKDDGSYLSTNHGERKLIILDEADNLYERSRSNQLDDYNDKGGKQEIINTIKISNQPIILIVNDYYALIKGSGEILKRLCKIIRFFPPYSNQIVNHLKKICISEGIETENDVLYTISERCNGDVRSAVNDLQAISQNRKFIDMNSLNVLGYRDRDKIIFDILREIFKTKDIRTIKQNVLNLNEDPNNIILWLNENLFKEYKKIDDINRAYNYLSQSDIFLSRTFKRQYFGFWSYAIDLMCGGVANSKTITYHNENYLFPIWLKKLKYENKNIFLINSILNKLSKISHISNYKTKVYMFDYFKILFQNNNEFSNNMANLLNLTDEEIIYLSDKKYEQKTNKISNSKNNIIKKSIDKDKKIKENNKEIKLQYNLNDF